MLHPLHRCATLRTTAASQCGMKGLPLQGQSTCVDCPVAARAEAATLGGLLMPQLFTTDVLPPSDRIDAWQWNAQQICGDCRFQLPKSSFHGSIEIRHLAGLRLTRFSSSPLFFWKWPSDSTNPDNRFCIVITQLAGIRRYVQNGNSVLLNPGDTMMIDSGRPWSSSCGTDCTRLYLRVPRWMMENRLRMRDIPITQRIGGTRGAGAILSRLSQSLYEEAERLKLEEAAAALDAYFQILAACVDRTESCERHRPELQSRIQRFIDDHLSDPGLAPQKSRRQSIFQFAICTAFSQTPGVRWAIAFARDAWSSAETIWPTRACAAKPSPRRFFLGLQRFRSLQSVFPQAVWHLPSDLPRTNRPENVA